MYDGKYRCEILYLEWCKNTLSVLTVLLRKLKKLNNGLSIIWELILPSDDEDSGEDEDIPTRQNIKRQAQQLIDAKNRRKVAKRKKTKK